MKKSKIIFWVVIIIVVLAILALWFLLFGNRFLGGIVYNSKSGYKLDIQQIEASCANEIPLYLSPNAEGTKMQEWGKNFGYTKNDLLLSPEGLWYVSLNTNNANWKDAIKQARLDDLIHSYILPPAPLDGCTKPNK